MIFTAASALCGLASNLGELVAFRVLQGVGGGMLAPVGMAMLFRAFPPEERHPGLLDPDRPTTLAPALGPGARRAARDRRCRWRWVFFVNVPIGVAALAFGLLFLTDQPAGRSRPLRPARASCCPGSASGALMYGVSEGPITGWG